MASAARVTPASTSAGMRARSSGVMPSNTGIGNRLVFAAAAIGVSWCSQSGQSLHCCGRRNRVDVHPEGMTGAAAGARACGSRPIEVRRIDWWATAVQLLGTLFFNVTTFTALDAHLTAKQSD